MTRADLMYQLDGQMAGKILSTIVDYLFTLSPEFAVMENYNGILTLNQKDFPFACEEFVSGGLLKSLFIDTFISESDLTYLGQANENVGIVNLLSGFMKTLRISIYDLFLSQLYGAGKGTNWNGLRSQPLATKHWERPFSFASLAKVLPCVVTEERVAPYLGVMSPAYFAILHRTAPPFPACFVSGDEKNDVSKLGFDVVSIGGVDCVASTSVPPRQVFVWRKDAVGMEIVRPDDNGDFLEWTGFEIVDRGKSKETRGITGSFLINGNFRILPGACWRLT